MVSLSNNTQGNVNITTKNGKSVNITSNNDTDVNANMNGNSQRAKSWAVGEGLIDGVDYSAKYYAAQAKVSEEIAERSIQSEDNAHIWAEGTDEEVQALGGEHSSKGWVDYVMENAPTAEIEQTETGATITVTDIHGTTTADILNGAKGDKGDTGAQGEQGIQGAKGDTGATGNGISNVSKISTVGLVDTYRMLYTNGSYFDYTVTNGANGTGSVADVQVNGVSVLSGNVANIDFDQTFDGTSQNAQSGVAIAGKLTNYVTTDTAQSISGQKTFTSTIKSSVDNSLALTLSTGDAFGVTVTRTDANNEIKFGIGQSGDNRGIWDVRNNKWAFNVTNDGKSYTLGNEIAVKSDLNSLSPLRYSRYSIDQVNSTNKFIKLASMTFTQRGYGDFSYLFWVEILGASTDKCYALVRLSARWSGTSYTGHKFEILEKYGDPAASLEALKNLTYAYSLDTTTHTIIAEIWLEIKNVSYVSYYLRPTECNEYGDYSNTPVTLSNNVWTYYNQSGNASNIASTAITSGLTQVKVIDATGVRNENNLSQVMKMWTGTKAQYDAIATKDSNTIYNVEGVGLYKGTTLIAGALPNAANQDLSNLSQTGQAIIDGKADTDLSNLSATGKKVLYSKPTISRIAIVTEASQHKDIRTYSLANYLPDDGSDYLVQISCRVVTASTSGAFMNCNLTSSLQTNGVQFCGIRTRSNSLVEASGCGWMLIGSDRKLYHNGSDSTNYKGTYDIQAMAYIRVGSNS